ncbi:MAG: IclR family transcriptional regulator [Candidatus Adiutrix sp.]|jgi:DNA-binding IclR family transcriptional regulator|nr:IclR family transcriptional regulator [Candidatus Adiutrix sp.]
MGETNKKYYRINSLEKGLKALEAIVENGELTVTRAAALLNLNRASAHRFITTLRDLGYVRKNQHNHYEATFKLLELGMTQVGRFEIRRLAKPYMRDLAARFDETVNLGLLDRGQVVYLDKVESREMLRMDSGVGTACQPRATALGKAMLAFLPPDELEGHILTAEWAALTPNTIVSQDKFLKELEKVRRQGYAVDNEELAQGLYCVGAPIFDFKGYPAYALSVSGPVGRLKPLKEIPGRLLEITAQLSGQLGYRGGREETKRPPRPPAPGQ